MIQAALGNTRLPKNRTIREMLWHRWLALLPITLVLGLYPVNLGWLRLATLTGIALVWAGLLRICWRSKALRLAVLTLKLHVLVALCLPG